MLEYLEYAFFRNALAGVLLLSVVSGIVGTYIVTRRMVAISGGITHACFGGLGLGYFLGINPLLMAAAVAVGSSVGVEWMSERRQMREDTAIAVVWALGMAAGVLFVFLTPGYVPELNAFLFGNVLTISSADIWCTAVFVALLLILFAVYGRKIVICAFDRDFAAVAGLPVRMINYMMTVVVAIGIVLAIRMVGIMLLMSMMSLPQITAERFCCRFNSMMWVSTGISAVCCVGGLAAATMINVPCSAIIVLTLAAVYICTAAVCRLRK